MSTRYIIIFMLLLTSTVALTLTALRQATQETAERNEDIFNKRAVLLSVEDYLVGGKKVADLGDQEVLDIFNSMESRVVSSSGQVLEGVQAASINLEKEYKKAEADRQLPFYIYDNGTEKFYLLSIRGKGLWDMIWGYVALKNDLNTVAGAAFDHKGETPGLGGEIKDNPAFAAQFKGKKIYNAAGEYVSVNVRKGAAVDKDHDVDGISGATITCDGVTAMLYNGTKSYVPYLKTLK